MRKYSRSVFMAWSWLYHSALINVNQHLVSFTFGKRLRPICKVCQGPWETNCPERSRSFSSILRSHSRPLWALASDPEQNWAHLPHSAAAALGSGSQVLVLLLVLVPSLAPGVHSPGSQSSQSSRSPWVHHSCSQCSPPHLDQTHHPLQGGQTAFNQQQATADYL